MDVSEAEGFFPEPPRADPRRPGLLGLLWSLFARILAMTDQDRMLWVKVGVTVLALAAVGYLLVPTEWLAPGSPKRRRRRRERTAATDSAEDSGAPTADDSDSGRSRVQKSAAYPPGLHNLGNTCFMNSTLQALASLPSLLTYLETRVARHRLFQYASLKHHGRGAFTGSEIPVTEALLEILLELNTARKSSYKVIRPDDFLNALSQAANSDSPNGGGSVMGRRWLGFEQQDAHELYQLISSHLQTEHERCQSAKCGCCTGKRFQTAGLGDVFDLGPSKDSVVGSGSAKHELRIRNPSQGLVGSRLRCEECGYETPVRHQTFDNLSLVPPYEPTITLTSLLSSYTSPEYLDDVVCPNCSRKLTLEKLRLAIDKARKKCEIARKVFEAQESDKDSANHAAPLPGEMAPSKDPNCLRDLLPKVHAMEAVLPPDTIRLLSLPFSTWAETIPSPPHDINPALLRLDVELRRLHDLIHDLATLETVSPDEFLDLGRDKLSIEKVRHIPVKPYRTTKRLTISRFPKVLALHIQRSVYLASGRAVKNSCRVGGFGEFWDASLPGARRRSGIFARHDSSDATKQLFRLQSVVLHYGSHDSGHFVTYRRMPARRYGELADWSRVEESLDKIARGQDPQGRLAAWIEEWCNAASNGRLGASEREEATESNESSDPDAKEQVIASDLALRSSAEQLIAPTVPAELDSGSKALKVDTSPAKLEPGPDGESPTLHGSADEDNAIDTALDTDTDPGLSGEGDLANGVPELTVTTFAPLAEDGKTLSTSFAHAAKSTRLKTTRAPDRWFRISDETVELVDDPEREIYDMVSSQAYMIYFEREE